jgi:hypothetical protein
MAAALLLCAFPKLTGSEEKPNPPPANIEDQIRLLNDQLNSIDRRLTEIELGLMVTGISYLRKQSEQCLPLRGPWLFPNAK